MKVLWHALILLASLTAFPLAANAGKKESCLAQASLTKTIVKFRLAGKSKQSQLDTTKKVAANSPLAGLYATIIEVVYAAEKDELHLVPGMIYAECMK